MLSHPTTIITMGSKQNPTQVFLSLVITFFLQKYQFISTGPPDNSNNRKRHIFHRPSIVENGGTKKTPSKVFLP